MIIKKPTEEEIKAIYDFVEKLTCPVTFFDPQDRRNPPGEHEGTGWVFEKGGRKYLCTCEHVAKKISLGALGFGLYGTDSGVRVNKQFDAWGHPIDFAFSDVTDLWDVVPHGTTAASINQIKGSSKSVDNEIFFIYGFPGADTVSMFEQHNVKGIVLFTTKIDPPAEIYKETPPFMDKFHECFFPNGLQHHLGK